MNIYNFVSLCPINKSLTSAKLRLLVGQIPLFSVTSKRHFPLMGPFLIFLLSRRGGAPGPPPLNRPLSLIIISCNTHVDITPHPAQYQIKFTLLLDHTYPAIIHFIDMVVQPPVYLLHIEERRSLILLQELQVLLANCNAKYNSFTYTLESEVKLCSVVFTNRYM